MGAVRSIIYNVLRGNLEVVIYEKIKRVQQAQEDGAGLLPTGSQCSESRWSSLSLQRSLHQHVEYGCIQQVACPGAKS